MLRDIKLNIEPDELDDIENGIIEQGSFLADTILSQLRQKKIVIKYTSIDWESLLFNLEVEDISLTKKQNESKKEGIMQPNGINEILTTAVGEFAKNNIKDILKNDIDIDILLTNAISKKLPNVSHIQIPDLPSVDTTGSSKHLVNITEMLSLNIPVMLVGPAGCGKNVMLEKAAEILKLEFYPISSVQDEYKLTGFIDANGKFHETQFYKAFKKGGVFFLDEVDNSAAEVMVALNGAIANGYFDFPNGKVSAHKNFKVVAAANTFGNGADIKYIGRNALDSATLDRFVQIKVGYESHIEESICPDECLRKILLDLRKYTENENMRCTISYRGMSYAYKLSHLDTYKKDVKSLLKVTVLKGVNDETCDRLFMKLNISNNHKDSKSIKLPF